MARTRSKTTTRLDWRHTWVLRPFSEEFWLIECKSRRCVGAPDGTQYLIPAQQITEQAIDNPRAVQFTLIPLQPRLPAVL